MERNQTVSAVVLQTRRCGDLHRSITIFSPELGIVRALAYGARKGKLAGKIEQFLRGVFYVYENPVRHEFSIVDVQTQSLGEEIRSSLERTFAASFIAETVLRMEGGARQDLFDLVVKSFSALERHVDTTIVLIQYAWKFIAVAGLMPSLTQCPVCDTSYKERETLSYHSALHVPCCQRCSDLSQSDSPMIMGPGFRRYAVLTADLDFDDALKIGLSQATASRIKRYMLRYIASIAGGELKSLAMVL